MKNRTLYLCFLLTVLAFSATSAEAMIVTAGWIRSDIGLEEDGDGFYTGVQETWEMGNGRFDFTVAGEYLQKSGSMHRFYSDPHTGETFAKADVLLHCVQPAAFLGLRLPVKSFTSRLYAGASVVLKLSESWDEPEGSTAGDYGYENMDFQVHLGFANEISRFLVDIRFSYGLMDQLINQTSQNLYPGKADVDETLEDGAKISSLQIGVGYKF